MTRADILRLMRRDESVPTLEKAVAYSFRALAWGYLVEAELDGGTRIQSELIEDDYEAVLAFEEMRSKMMVTRVRILAAHTGVVFVDIPSRAITVQTWSRGGEQPDGTVGVTRVSVNR